jgi:hypothetical protein
METIIVSWQNGIHFSVKRKLSLYKCFPSKLSRNEYIVSNWRYHCNTVAIPLQNSFQSVSPETFRNPFLSVASGQFLYYFESVSLQVDRFSTVPKALSYCCKTVASQKKSRNISFHFCWIFIANSFQRISVIKKKNWFHPFATIMQRLIWRSSLNAMRF